MKNKILHSLFLLGCFAYAGTAQAETPPIYAATLQEIDGNQPSFILGAGSGVSATFIAPIDANDPAVTMRCGANANGTYYGLLTKNDAPHKLVTVNWEQGKTTDVADASSYPAFFDMAYSFQTNKLYGAAKEETGKTTLYEINMSDGTVTKAATLDIDAKTLDFDFAGSLYAFIGAPYDGPYGSVNAIHLAIFDTDFKEKETKRVYSDWEDYVGIYEYGTYNYFSMEFDHVGKAIYYTQTDAQQQYAYAIDTETGKRLQNSSMIGMCSNYSNMFNAVSMYIPFTAPDGGANSAAAVTSLQATAASDGSGKATLT